MPHVSSAVATHPGLRRAGNEDAFCCRPDLGLYVVADGMGGHAAGEVASQLAVQAIEAFVAATREPDPNRTWPLPYDPALSADANRLKAALQLANRKLNSEMAADDALRGMATTAVAVLVAAESAVVAHVGDSRVYRWRAGELILLTEDHSWVGEQVRAGMLTDEDARRHPWRNVVTRAIGGGADPDVDVASVDLRAADRLLLCSDGLSAVISQERMESICAEQRPLQETCNLLVDAANEAGGPDNVTVLILQVDVA